MTPTARDLAALAAHHRLISELLHDPQVQTAIITHYHDLHGHGLKAAVTDTDGSRASTPTSGPEQAVTTPPDAASKAAANIRTALGNAKHANAMLSQIITTATERREPVPTKCRVCSNGMIPVGLTRCSNEKCNSHGDTVITCANGCGQRLITGTTGKTKPHTIDTVEGPVCRSAYLAHQKLKRYERTKQERGTGTIDVTLGDTVINETDAA